MTYKLTVKNLAAEYTLGHYTVANPYHVPIIRTQLTRNIADLFDEIKDEISQAFSDNIVLEGNGTISDLLYQCYDVALTISSIEWKTFPALETVMPIVCRTSNRVFVGLPTCERLVVL